MKSKKYKVVAKIYDGRTVTGYNIRNIETSECFVCSRYDMLTIKDELVSGYVDRSGLYRETTDIKANKLNNSCNYRYIISYIINEQGDIKLHRKNISLNNKLQIGNTADLDKLIELIDKPGAKIKIVGVTPLK